MKNLQIYFFMGFVFIVASLLFAGAIIVDFNGLPGYNKVTIKWTTQNEINLKGFEVERSLESDKNFNMIAFVKVSNERKSKKEYTYDDKEVFKSFQRTFYYRLKILDNDGKFSHSKIIQVTPTVSSARQTWGSIKAMFR